MVVLKEKNQFSWKFALKFSSQMLFDGFSQLFTSRMEWILKYTAKEER
jgi:hypothetical protein